MDGLSKDLEACTVSDVALRPLGDPFDVASLHEFHRILLNLGKELFHIVDSEFTMLRTRGGEKAITIATAAIVMKVDGCIGVLIGPPLLRRFGG